MKYTVVTYLAGIPAKNKNLEKPLILKNFATGVRKAGDTVIEHTHPSYIPSDVGVLQGWTHEDGKQAPHLILRKSVIDGQRLSNKRVITADSSLFLYKNKNNPHHYLRYSYDGVFPNTGDYCDKIVDSDRWRKISKNIGIELREMRSTGTHILLCLQRNGGWSMKGFDVQDWALTTVETLRSKTDRPIKIRSHPGDAKAQIYLDPKNSQYKLKHLKNITISNDGRDFSEDLKNAWAVVVHNSSPAVAAAIEGYPIFLTDPLHSQAAEVADHNLDNIETPNLNYDRQKWVERISMFHWNFEELINGSAWNHMRQYARFQ